MAALSDAGSQGSEVWTQSEQKRLEAFSLIQQMRAPGTPKEDRSMTKVLAVLDEALELCPLNHRARFLKVSCAMNMEDYQLAKVEAIKIYDALSKPQLEQMDNPMLHLSIVHASKMTSDTEQAFHFAREAVHLYPTDPQAFMVLGQLHEDAGQIQETEYMCRQVILHNDSPNCKAPLSTQNVYFTLSCLGSSLLQQGKASEAEAFLVRAIRLGISSPLAYKYLSQVYHRQGRIDEALQAAQMAREQDPDDKSIQASLQLLKGLSAERATPRGQDGDQFILPGAGDHGAKAGGSQGGTSRAGSVTGMAAVPGTSARHDELEQAYRRPAEPREPEEKDPSDWFACCCERDPKSEHGRC